MDKITGQFCSLCLVYYRYIYLQVQASPCGSQTLLTSMHFHSSLFGKHKLQSQTWLSNRRASLDDFRRRLILKSLKVIYEELAKLHHFLFEVSLA